MTKNMYFGDLGSKFVSVFFSSTFLAASSFSSGFLKIDTPKMNLNFMKNI